MHVIVQHVVLLVFFGYILSATKIVEISQCQELSKIWWKKSEQHTRGNGSHTFDSLILDMHVIMSCHHAVDSRRIPCTMFFWKNPNIMHVISTILGTLLMDSLLKFRRKNSETTHWTNKCSHLIIFWVSDLLLAWQIYKLFFFYLGVCYFPGHLRIIT